VTGHERREDTVGFILEAIINWWWVGCIKKLSEKYPPWVWVSVMVSPVIIVIGVIYLLII
jgi:hypothetical protein